MFRTISNSDDVLDSRDVIERLEQLQSERADLVSEAEDDTNVVADEAKQALAEWDEENGQELKELTALTENAEGYSDDWRYGATLIRDSYFEEYAREFAEDIGAIPKDTQWPCTCIDWEQAAKELQSDYTAVEYGDVTYWVR